MKNSEILELDSMYLVTEIVVAIFNAIVLVTKSETAKVQALPSSHFKENWEVDWTSS